MTLLYGGKGCFCLFCRPYGSISGVMTPSLPERSALPPVATHPHTLLMLFSTLQLVTAKGSFTLYKIICFSVFLCVHLCIYLLTFIWHSFGVVFSAALCYAC